MTARIGIAPAIVGLVAGAASAASSGHTAGRPDRSFSENGKTTTSFGGFAFAQAVAIDAHERPVVAGYKRYNGFAIARYTRGGKPDRSFSRSGRATLRFSPHGDAFANDVAIDSKGRIVVAGSATTDRNNDVYNRFALARLKNDGKLDHSFSRDGLVKSRFVKSSSEQIMKIAFDHEGRILVVGELDSQATGRHLAIARYRPSGGLDHSFGDDGLTIGVEAERYSQDSIALDRSGRIYVGCAIATPGQDPSNSGLGRVAVSRYSRNGTLDDSFGDDGTALAPGRTRVVGMDLSARRVTVVGTNSIVAFTREGKLDRSFAGDGSKRNALKRPSYFDSVLVDRQGRTYATGSRYSPKLRRSQLAVWRYRPDGGTDHSFGSGDGVAEKSLSRTGDDSGEDLALDSRRRIVVAGTANSARFGVARFLGR